MKRSRPELLAPAGSPEALQAAIQNGADAIYLGYGSFNARQSAKNFSETDFAQALIDCHVRGVRVFLTLNTLLSDRELPEALEIAATACRLGVDAVLVQDWGLLLLLRASLPDLPIHASTQMSIFTSGATEELVHDGCERIVLARECSCNETAKICRNLSSAFSKLNLAVKKPEVEVFVHGALCMSYSGQCTMSALIGKRSGNRGRCAQPCRMAYGFDAPAKNQFPLSLKDNCLADKLEDMQDMGISCLKLEGRMKRPEYTAAVTGIYARLLNEQRRPTQKEREILALAFSRSGFTDAYWQGHHGADMFGIRPQNLSEPREFFAKLRADYESGRLRTIPICFSGSFSRGVPCQLTVSDPDGHQITITGPVPETARTRSLTSKDLQNRLKKTGGTPYQCVKLSLHVDPGLSLSAADINALRRNALDALTKVRTKIPARRILPTPSLPEHRRVLTAPEFTISISNVAQLTERLLALQPARVLIPLEILATLSTLPKLQENTENSVKPEWCAILPRIWRDRDEDLLCQWLTHAQSLGVTGVILGNIGHFSILKKFQKKFQISKSNLHLYGDFGLNAYNSYALEYLRQKNLDSICISFELRFSQIRDLKKPLDTEAIVYGRLPLMITENCLVQNALGCMLDKSGLVPVPPRGAPCRKSHVLRDRTGAAFPLLPAYGHRTEIQNSLPLWLADIPVWKRLGLRYARLRFTTESPEMCVQVFQDYLENRASKEKFTRGLYERGVE